MTAHRLPTVSLYFRFYGASFDPDEITRRLGIEPTTRFRPGEPITKDGRGRRRGYGWWVQVGDVETLEIDDLLRQFRDRVDVSPSTVRQMCDDLGLELIVVCGVRQHASAESTPTLFFPADFLGWLAELGAALNVDVVL